MRRSSSGVPSRFIKTSLQSINESSNEVFDSTEKGKANGNEKKDERPSPVESFETEQSSRVAKVSNNGSVASEGPRPEDGGKADVDAELEVRMDTVPPPMMKISTLAELKRFSWHTALRKRTDNTLSDLTKTALQAQTAQSVAESETENKPQAVSSNVLPKADDAPSKVKARWTESAKRITESEEIKQERAFRKLIQTRACDPEAVLHDLGFAGDSEQNGLAERLPLRFLMQPSEAAGVDVLRLIRQHPELAAFASELAAVNPYLRPLRATDDSSAQSQRFETHRSTDVTDGKPQRLDIRALGLSLASNGGADETETRASILRRFTNSQSQKSATPNGSSTPRLAQTRSSFSDAPTAHDDLELDGENDRRNQIPLRMRKHSLIAHHFVSNLHASASASGCLAEKDATNHEVPHI